MKRPKKEREHTADDSDNTNQDQAPAKAGRFTRRENPECSRCFTNCRPPAMNVRPMTTPESEYKKFCKSIVSKQMKMAARFDRDMHGFRGPVDLSVASVAERDGDVVRLVMAA